MKPEISDKNRHHRLIRCRFAIVNSSKLSILEAIKGHFQTILPYLFRKVDLPDSESIEIALSDGDFVDAEYWKGQGYGLAILSHGLEGNSNAVYMRAMTQSYLRQGWDVLAWNFRACSGRMNQNLRLYHSGAFEDLKEVVEFAHNRFQPIKIQVIGFSLGGNMTLLFLAKMGLKWLQEMKIEKGLAISPPINLWASSRKLDSIWNRAYRFNFLKDLKNKIKEKSRQFPKDIDLSKLPACKTIFDFDHLYTAPMHGFDGAIDYYTQCSSLYHLSEISIPTMIILAKNDPMLARGNYDELENLNPLLTIKILEKGGHCGFWGMGIF